MPAVCVSTHFNAAPEAVFHVCSDFASAAGRIKDITKLELVTPGPVGVGTRFRETRVMFGKEATEEMTVSAFDPPRSYEITAQTCGAEFRTMFRFVPDGAGTRVDVELQTRALSFFAKLMKPLSFLMRGMMKKCLVRDLDDLKKFAEGTPPGP